MANSFSAFNNSHELFVIFNVIDFMCGDSFRIIFFCSDSLKNEFFMVENCFIYNIDTFNIDTNVLFVFSSNRFQAKDIPTKIIRKGGKNLYYFELKVIEQAKPMESFRLKTSSHCLFSNRYYDGV